MLCLTYLLEFVNLFFDLRFGVPRILDHEK